MFQDLFLSCLPQNSRLIVVDAKDRPNKLLYTRIVVSLNDPLVNNECLLLFNNYYYPVPPWRRGVTYIIIV